jgi:drug/metabolite transporter (DMT)-like permease
MAQLKLDRLGLIAALCATAAWGLSGVFVRWLPGWSPFLILLGRFLVAIALLLPMLLFTPKRRRAFAHALANPQVWWLSLPVVASSLFGVTAFQMAPVGEATLFFTTSPLFVIAYKGVRRLPIQRSEVVGLGLALTGVCLIVLPRLSMQQATSWKTLMGYGLALAAAGLVALYATWFKGLAETDRAPKTIHILSATFILGIILSFCCERLLPNLSTYVEINASILLIFLGLGTLSTVVSFFCYTVAIQRLPIILSTAILLLEPLFAVLFAAIALQEIPSGWFGIGSLLVCAGLLVIARGGDSSNASEIS